MSDSNWALYALGTTAAELVHNHNSFVRQLQSSQDERVCTGIVDGVLTETRPFHTDRRHERCYVFLGVERAEIACEWTTIPWNIFKDITVSYWVWVDRTTKGKAQFILDHLKIEGRVEEDPYAVPARYHIWVYTLEDVVKVYKYLKEKGELHHYLPQKEAA